MTKLSKGATSCLEALRCSGHVLAIVTNGASEQQHAKIDVLGLRAAVAAVVVSGDIGIAKPDAGIFEAAATDVGHSLIDSWTVGDSPSIEMEVECPFVGGEQVDTAGVGGVCVEELVGGLVDVVAEGHVDDVDQFGIVASERDPVDADRVGDPDVTPGVIRFAGRSGWCRRAEGLGAAQQPEVAQGPNGVIDPRTRSLWILAGFVRDGGDEFVDRMGAIAGAQEGRGQRGRARCR